MEQDRQMAIDLIEEAVAAGARRFKACEVLEIDVRTLQRWNKTLAEEKRLVDQRKAAASERAPANKLSHEEREAILSVCRKPELVEVNANGNLAPVGIVYGLFFRRQRQCRACSLVGRSCVLFSRGANDNTEASSASSDDRIRISAARLMPTGICVRSVDGSRTYCSD